MNKIKLIIPIVLVLFMSTLIARENPFIPTQAFLDEKAAIIEQKEQEINPKILLEYKANYFISIKIYDNHLKINTPNNKLFRHFKLLNENKIVLDFKKSNKFLTSTKVINQGNISKIIIGDHPEKDFFRVVILINKDLSIYNLEYQKSNILINNFN